MSLGYREHRAGSLDLSKELSSSSKGLAKWNISAANAAGESSFTLVETLRDAVNESGQTQSDTHYAYAAELEKALEEGLTLTLHDGGTMNYAQAKAAGVITVTYYSGTDGTGGTVTANDPSTRVRSFTIQINKADGNPVRRVEVKDLPTHEDQSNVPTGEKMDLQKQRQHPRQLSECYGRGHLPQLQEL